jgi:DNA helicase-2/ATP-dependent DNA helicase PcrA
MGEKREDDEEERRLFYVALTRARKCLYLSCAGIRTIFGQKQVNVPSEFITDIDESLIEQEERQVRSSAKDIFIDF